MIYTASYFEKANHHGKLISISYSEPKGFRVDGKLPFLVPSKELLFGFKSGGGVDRYTETYREECRKNLRAIDGWLRSLSPDEDLTLLCWEKKGEFCHRNLVIKFVERYRPDCFGGCDIPRVKV